MTSRMFSPYGIGTPLCLMGLTVAAVSHVRDIQRKGGEG